MTPLVYFLCSINTLMLQQAPTGTQLQLRLTNTIGSFSSHAGDPVSAVLIAPVLRDGRTVLPQGVEFSGKITRVTRVGYGVRHETASLRLEFNRMVLPDGESVPIATKVTQVDNGREKVAASGAIQGIRSTGSISYRVSGYVRTAILWDVHAEMAEWAIKSLLVELPEPEIYYPAGTEMKIALTRPLPVLAASEPEETEDMDSLRDVIARLPVRTQDPETKHPSDLTNVLLIGSREEISKAFRAAGWSEARADSIRARVGTIRAAAEIHGFSGAPMSALLLRGAEADMSWQKSLNDVSKRHHIRIWKQAETWNGQELWMAAATRDVDFAYLRPGRPFTHEIDPKIDEERDKVAYDLAFTSCAKPLTWAAREGIPRLTHNATGDPIGTDARMVVVEFNACESPRMSTETRDTEPVLARGSKMQRFFRREILVTRSDFLRTNVYYRSYEITRWAYQYFKYRRKKSEEMKSLLATYGPAGSTPGRSPARTLQAFR